MLRSPHLLYGSIDRDDYYMINTGLLREVLSLPTLASTAWRQAY